MQGNGNVIVVYTLYVAVAVGLTIWLARTLFHNGTVFLEDVFEGVPGLARSVNHLLVVGFYMLSLGYGLYILDASRGMDSLRGRAVPRQPAGGAARHLAGIHFVNVFVFWRIRVYRERRNLPTPIAPTRKVSPPPKGSEW